MANLLQITVKSIENMLFSYAAMDILAFFHLINDSAIEGPVNATVPAPVTNRCFSKALGSAMKRPAILPLPAFPIALLFGSMGQTILLAEQKVLPKKVIESDFEFRHATINSALQAIFRS